MNRQYHSPSNICCCGRSEHSYRPTSRNFTSKDSSTEEENEYPDYNYNRYNFSWRNNQQHKNRVVHDRLWNHCFSRQHKTSQYQRSEMEEASTANAYCYSCSRENENQYDNASLLRRANDLIDYAPESEFLKKMKQQCQFLQNRQPNIFSSLNKFVQNEMPIYECQKCNENSPTISKGERTNGNRFRCSTERLWKCNCNQASYAADSNDDRKFFKNVTNVQRTCKENKAEEEEVEKKNIEKISKNSKKKSEHVSRSKKPEKCRGRRKRKSTSSEKCDLENQFEPTLKKPHENSCERCWRFASPARSPVNKPDQKFNPNFRRFHSYMDLEKENKDLVEKESSIEKLRPGVLKEKARSLSPPICGLQTSPVTATGPSQVSKDIRPSIQGPNVQSPMHSSIKVKEMINKCPFQKPLEKYLPTSQAKDFPQKSEAGPSECPKILCPDSGRKPTKCQISGVYTPETGRCPRPMNDFSLTDYKTICMNPKKQCFNSTDSTKQSKTPLNLMPSCYKEACRGCSPGPSGGSSGGPSGGPSDRYNLKPIPEATKDKYDNSGKARTSDNLGRSSKNISEFEDKTAKTDSTAKSELSSDKNTKPVSSSKKTVSENARSETSKSKGNQTSNSTKSKTSKTEKKSEKKAEKKSEKKPQKKIPQSGKSQTSSERFDKICGGNKEKSKSEEDSVAKEFHFNPAPNCGSKFEHTRTSHPIRDCSCYPRIPNSKNDSDNENDHVFCCHCDWETSQKDKPAPFKTAAPAPPVCGENERFYHEPNIELNDRRFVNNPNTRSWDYNHFQRSAFPESDNTQASRGGTNKFSCPYREYRSSRTPVRSNTPENSRCQNWENDRRTPRDYRYVPGNQDIYPECSPRKYFMFYMTKCNEKKKGDDVEVLIEELSQACPDGKNTRTKDIAEKMKKIMECPSDSMALRFQKGVSESYKIPPSSRVLYF